MSSSLSLALLVCDTPLEAIVETQGAYPQIFNTLFTKSTPPKLSFTLDPYDVVHKMEYPPDTKHYDGIIITGSAASAYEDVKWINKLVSYVARIATSKPDIKIIGICFGHQIVARALGGECVPNSGKWEAGITEVDLTDLGKQLFGADKLNIQQMHRDHVPSLPPTFHLLGSTPISYNQGMVRYAPNHSPSTTSSLTDIQILTLQGHPEFTEYISSTIIDTRVAAGKMDVHTAEIARQRAQWRNDGIPVIGKVIWGVLGAADISEQ